MLYEISNIGDEDWLTANTFHGPAFVATIRALPEDLQSEFIANYPMFFKEGDEIHQHQSFKSYEDETNELFRLDIATKRRRREYVSELFVKLPPCSKLCFAKHLKKFQG